MDCCHGTNPYLACSERLIQMQNYTRADYEADIQALQTATSTWYLSIQSSPDTAAQVGSKSATAFEQQSSPPGHLCSKLDNPSLSSLSPGDPSLQNEDSTLVNREQLPASPVPDYTAGRCTVPAHDSYQPSLMDVQPSVFQSCCTSSPAKGSPSCTLAKQRSSFNVGATMGPAQPHSTEPECGASTGSPGLPFSMAALGPSVEKLMQPADGNVNLSPTVEITQSLAGCAKSPIGDDEMRRNSNLNATSAQLVASGLVHRQNSVKGATSSCFLASPPEHEGVQWHIAEGATGVGSKKHACGSAMNSCIPAFHHNMADMSDSGCHPFVESFAASHGHSSQPDGSLPVLMPILHSAFNWQGEKAAMSGMEGPQQELRDTSSCGAVPGMDVDEAEEPDVQEAGSSPARLFTGPADDACGDDIETSTLRRVCSLIPQRGAMLTPASQCLGAYMLTEAPELHTYKKRDPRRRKLQNHSSVTFVDNPTVNVYEAGQDTAGMTVSAAPVLRPCSDSQHAKHTRMSSSYLCMRNALVLHDGLSHTGAENLHLSCRTPPAAHQGNEHFTDDGFSVSGASKDEPSTSHEALGHPWNRVKNKLMARNCAVPETHNDPGSTEMQQHQLSTWTSSGVPEAVASLGANILGVRPNGRVNSHENSLGSVSIDQVQHSEHSNSSFSLPAIPSGVVRGRSNGNSHADLIASLDIICQALVDSKNLQVHTELGCKLSSPPSWMEAVTLMLCSLSRPQCVDTARLSEDDICEICQQIAYIFLPVGSAITAMQMSLMSYLESTGVVRPQVSASASQARVPQGAPLSQQAADAIQHSHMVAVNCTKGMAPHPPSGPPGAFLTALLPQVMFDYIACLLNIGMKMDQIGHQHNIKGLKAVNILKQQVAYVLGEMTDLSSTTVSAVMALCRGHTPSNPGQLESLSSFLVALLDQMSASVSLMHGRLPLNESDEALLEIARTDHTSQRARSCSTAFFLCLSVCGHVLHVLERVTKDMQAWQKEGGATCICPCADDGSVACEAQHTEESMGTSVLGTLPGVSSALSWQHIGQEWKILLETMPKVQATGCRLVMLVGSIIKSISDDAHADLCRLGTLPDSKHPQAFNLNLRCSSPGPARLNTLASSASRAWSMALPSPLRMSRSVRAFSFSRTFGEQKVSSGFQISGSHRRGSPMAQQQQESLSIVLPGGSDRCSWDGTLGSQTPPVTPPAARKDSRMNSAPVCKQPSSSCHRLRIDECEREEQDQHSPPPSPPALIGPYSCGNAGNTALPALNTVSHTSVGMFDSVISGSPSKTPRSLTPPPGLSKLQVHRPNEICSTPYGDSASGSPQISPFICPPGSPMSALSPAVGKHGLTFRALLDASSPTLVIEEPVLELGPLSAKDDPVSPIAGPMVRRRLAMPQSSELSMAPCDLDNGDPSKLSDNPVYRHRRAVSMSLSHIQTAVPSSLCMTSSAADKHSLRKNSSGSSKRISASSSQLRQTVDAPGKLPGALTVQEVSEVQSALARGIAALGTELVGFLQSRCQAIVESVGGNEGATDHSCMEWEHSNPLPTTKCDNDTSGNAVNNKVSNRQLATILARCEQAAHAQLSICHNLRRWTQVLCASESLDSGMYTFLSAPQAPGRISAETSGEGDNSLDNCQHMCNKLEESTEGLRSTAQAGKQCVGAAVGCDARDEPPMELLLGSAIKPLGCKSLGSVWMHHLGAEYVAVKWVKIEDQPLNRGYTAAQKQNMVIHEVEALLRLKHPNIVQFLGVTTMHTPCSAHLGTCSEEGSGSDTDGSCPSSPTDASQKLAVRKNLPSIGIVLELCHYGTLQDFLNQTRALFNNSSRLCVSAQGFQVRSGTCSSALESMCLCFINSWSQRLRMGKEIALALAACHASGVLHRDVTSFNVMLSDMSEGSESAAEHALRWCELSEDEDFLEVWSLPWSTRLIDFGLSKNGVARGGADSATASIDMHSLPWMAPEIIQGSEHLQSGDVYGLGMVLWELLTTHQPPVRTLPSVVRAGGCALSESQEAAGPCAPALREMRHLHEQGKTAELMRKLHGVPCPVLSEMLEVIQATQCSDPSQRMSAAAVAQRLSDLESRCSLLPGEAVAMDDEGLARYFTEPDANMDEAMTPFSDLTPFSSSSTL